MTPNYPKTIHFVNFTPFLCLRLNGRLVHHVQSSSMDDTDTVTVV